MKILSRFIVSVILAAFALSSLAAANGKDVEKGTPEAPPNTKAIVGTYYRGDGTGYNIYLTLNADGKYTAEWHGCLGKYGEASGKWTLDDKRITLKPSKEDGMMQGHLKELDVLKYKGQWIFVSTKDRDFYDKWGVDRYSCFQKQEKK